MEIFFGYQFEDFCKPKIKEDLLKRVLEKGIITKEGYNYLKGVLKCGTN